MTFFFREFSQTITRTAWFHLKNKALCLQPKLWSSSHHIQELLNSLIYGSSSKVLNTLKSWTMNSWARIVISWYEYHTNTMVRVLRWTISWASCFGGSWATAGRPVAVGLRTLVSLPCSSVEDKTSTERTRPNKRLYSACLVFKCSHQISKSSNSTLYFWACWQKVWTMAGSREEEINDGEPEPEGAVGGEGKKCGAMSRSNT